MGDSAARPQQVVDEGSTGITLTWSGLEYLGTHGASPVNDGETIPDTSVTDALMAGMATSQPIQVLHRGLSEAQMPIITLNAMARDRDAVAGFLTRTDAYAFASMNVQDFIGTITHYVRSSTCAAALGNAVNVHPPVRTRPYTRGNSHRVLSV